jgi:hypothetical protein
MPRVIVCVWSLVLIAGCGSAPPRSIPDFGISYERFSAPIGEDLVVNIGDHIFVEGEVVHVPVLSLSQGVNSTMPGAYGVPFSFSIDQTDLELSYERGTNQFYCAPANARSASFPSLGSVVEESDCVGIVIDARSGEKRWVVDNSAHNGMTTVWSRPVKESDSVSFTQSTKTRTDSRANMEVVYFEGFYSGLLHFKYHQFEGGAERIQDFKYDYPPREGTAEYGVRGKTFEVVDVDNTKMTYRWVSIPAS